MISKFNCFMYDYKTDTMGFIGFTIDNYRGYMSLKNYNNGYFILIHDSI